MTDLVKWENYKRNLINRKKTYKIIIIFTNLVIMQKKK